ncbi:MAG TPA: ABC-type transport auxiliary lipoprotein family protein [Candidatus Binatia bacterium]|nr:ABC-type transport auxiliary lipoprotein family protein [Candidatus Binatia bacterium]
MSRATTRRLFLLAGAAGAAAGCGIVPNVSKPLTLYTLKPQVAPTQPLPKVPWQLVVAEPAAERDIDTTRIALTRTANVIEYFADGNWTDTAPALVQAKMIEAFEGTNAIVAVGRDAAGLKPDYILQSDLRDFEAVYQGGAGAAPVAHVQLIAKLVQMPDRRITRTVSADASVAAASKDLPAIVTAFEQALGQVLSKIVTDILIAG